MTRFSARRRHHRLRRLRLHPDRDRRSDRLTVMSKIAHGLYRELGSARSTLQRVAQERKQLKDDTLRSRAELDNVRKRAARTVEDGKKFAAQGLTESLLPALDSFDQALSALGSTHDSAALAEGVQAIHQQLERALASHGVEKIVPLNEPFDPNFHEALAVEKTADHPHNTIIDVLQSGYVLNGRLIRPARVRIAQRD